MKHLLCPLLLLALAVGILAGGCGDELPSSSVTGEGYARVVLAELLTTTWCGWCPTAEEAMDRLFDEEGPERLAVIHWHPSYGQGDPYAIEAADARAALYASFVGDPPGFPVCVYDGVSYFRGGWVGLYDDYRSRYEEEAALGSDLQLTLAPEIEGNSAAVGIQIQSLPALTPGAYDLVVAAVEHHAVEGDRTTSYVARAATTQAVNLQADALLTQDVDLALEPDWKREDLWIVAFVQQPAGTGSVLEVLQAAMVPLIPAEEEFYAFVLSAPDTTVSLASGGARDFSFTIQNTGTLDDSVTVDLPASLTSLPAGWTVGLRTADGAELVTPSTSPIAAGERIDTLRLHVTADAPGSGTVGISCASAGDAVLVDTLSFQVEAGSYGVALTADETDLDVLAGTAFLAPITVANAGSVADSIALALPDSLANVPEGWQIGLADRAGSELADPFEIELAAGAAQTDLRLWVLASGEGEARVTLQASSQGDPAQSQSLEFSIAALSYNFSLTSDQTNLQAVVGTPAVAPFEITNSGSRDDLLILDLPADPALPGDWLVSLVYGTEAEVETPHALLLERGESAIGFGVRVVAGSVGSAAVPLVVRSSGNPSLADTLSFEVTAEEYGIELRAPQGSSISLSPGVATLVPFELQNSGTLDDTILLDLPEGSLAVPEDWEISLTDAQETELALPFEVSLEAGEVLDTLFVRAWAPEDGSGTVELTAASQGLPTLTANLAFDFSTSQYGFEIEADTDVEAEEVPGFTMAPFTLRNTGAADDVLTVSAPTELQQPPPGWGPAIICDDEQCFPPGWEIDVPVDAGASFSGYYVDWFIPGSGVGLVDLVVVSQGDPALADTLTFTFTSAKRVTPLAEGAPSLPRLRSSKPMVKLPTAGASANDR
ncbi:MAG: hypothetical protein GF330_12225 [Candidatus Eisenbacteria bacterium]|nr:hypothetical protein [Candidatus Eisenbacteria bacterium]